MDGRDTELMREALDLAARGWGHVSPNPMVGAIVVATDGEVAGRGWYEGPRGAPHAEVRAIRDAGDRARGATLYCTLEPCDHHGATPPCSEAIVAAGVARVVVGATDPNPLVDGRGLARLRAEGVDVRDGLLAADARRLNAAFERHVTQRPPFRDLEGRVLAGRQDGRDRRLVALDHVARGARGRARPPRVGGRGDRRRGHCSGRRPALDRAVRRSPGRLAAASRRRQELEARGVALRDLAARCVAEVTPAPRFAVPDVSALGRVPSDPGSGGRLPGQARRRRTRHDHGAGRLRNRARRSVTSCAAGWRGTPPRPAPSACARSSAGRPRRPGAPYHRGPRHQARRPRPRPGPPRGVPGLSRQRAGRSEARLDPAPRRHAMTSLHPARLHRQHPRRLLRRLRLPGRHQRAAPGRRVRPSARPPGSAPSPAATGTIVDGYCDVCGSPGADAPRGTSGRQPPASPRPRRPCRAPRTGSRRRPWAPRAPRPVAPRSPAASAPPRPGCAAPGWVRD